MIIKKKLVVFAILFSTFSPKISFGWGIAGHHMIAEIAYLMLSEPAKQKLNRYLSGTSIQDASTWMDEQKRNPAYQYLSDRHFINIEKGQLFSDPVGKNNIYSQLTEVMAELENIATLPAEKVKYDLQILIHLMGDLHQPLHVAFGEDKGGNTVNTIVGNKKMNLHLTYDIGIIELKDISTGNIIPQLAKLSSDEKLRIEKGNLGDWIFETRNLLPFVYGFDNSTLHEDYLTKAQTLIENQILKAGIRLSYLLETYLGKADPIK